ncbi:hypothetical protein MOO44_00810 (plasmid) [Nicoliella spurrieriana]|uniref:Uncharacterized protein n=1 Tax=Nicoliella spurrieriana TaxID=2925830 RepID=A0A976RR07_9LACO|nr:hypothetical protein [Nicoliella spurrieriana]UQS86213.1 hypothetical protein MOO44_00810 [Nicoliella spurrieriana]
MNFSKKVVTAVAAAALFSSVGVTSANAMSTYNQKQTAVTSIPSVKVVDNTNVFKKLQPYSGGKYQSNNQGNLNHITVGRGATNVSFTTHAFLMTSAGSPQSAVQVGKYLYTMYNANRSESDNDLQDYIVRYDTSKLQNNQFPTDAIKVGPTFNGGHGQSLSYNPKTKQLWFLNIARGSAESAAAELVSQSSLKPTNKVQFKFSQNGSSIDNNLTFDKYGRAYTYVKSGGGSVPQGAYKIYRGSISTKGVHFTLMRSAIRYSAGSIPQGFSYNPKNGRLYFISDGVIISAPSGKLNNLSKSDIKYVRANTNREFESMVFTKSGKGYLISLRPDEMMTMKGSF